MPFRDPKTAERIIGVVGAFFCLLPCARVPLPYMVFAVFVAGLVFFFYRLVARKLAKLFSHEEARKSQVAGLGVLLVAIAGINFVIIEQLRSWVISK